MEDIALLDATAQAALVHNGEVTATELVEAAIARIEAVNPQLNAVVTPLYDYARKAAARVNTSLPFAGVPFLLKDLGATLAGSPITDGSRFVTNLISERDSELVARYKRAGLIIVGKTNTPEFGIPPTTEPKLFGPTRNPWDTTRHTGGSSGGSAAAVAAGMVPAAHANDGGGSIRIPASCCGLFGLKPTRARNPLGPDVGESLGGLVAEHVVTRSVRDSASLLDATAGPDLGDPYWAPPPFRPFAEEVGADPGQLRIAMSTEAATGAPVDPQVVAAIEDAAALCRELGHEVIQAAPEVDAQLISQAFIGVYAAGVTYSVDSRAQQLGKAATQEEVEPLTWALYQMGQAMTGPALMAALENLKRASRSIAGFADDYDLMLTPTLSEPPLPLGTFDDSGDEPMMAFFRAAQYAPFTAVANFTGQPAMSVPLYWTDDQLPIGAHFIARFGDEATLFRLASQLEKARPWAERRPPVFAG